MAKEEDLEKNISFKEIFEHPFIPINAKMFFFIKKLYTTLEKKQAAYNIILKKEEEELENVPWLISTLWTLPHTIHLFSNMRSRIFGPIKAVPKYILNEIIAMDQRMSQIKKNLQSMNKKNFVILNFVETLIKNNRLSFNSFVLSLEGFIELAQAAHKSTVGYLTKRIDTFAAEAKKQIKPLWNPVSENALFFFQKLILTMNIAVALCRLFKLDNIILVVRRCVNLCAGLELVYASAASTHLGLIKLFDTTFNSKKMTLMKYVIDQMKDSYIS